MANPKRNTGREQVAGQPAAQSLPRWASLPEYERPPVVETVLSVHFKSARELNTVSIVEFWQERLRGDLPSVEERERYEPPIERFDQPAAMSVGQFAFGVGTIPNRYWFSSDDGAHLVQLQSDWFAFNWRKTVSGRYERYASGLNHFSRYWQELNDFMRTREFEEVRPLQCEVTYVNHIPAGPEWSHHGELHRILRVLNSLESSSLPAPEGQSFSARFPIANSEGRSVGRLHISCDPVFTPGVKDPTPMFVLTLTARGRPFEGTTEGIYNFFELGHEWVVGSFDGITAEQMHQSWGRKEREQ